MLRFRRSILTQIISSSSASSVSQLRRLLSAAAPHISPNATFVVEEYLVRTCGLTPAQALKASTKLSQIKSPTKPDAVIAFFAGLGLSTADLAVVVSKDPKLLCSAVEKTLAPIVTGLADLGLSRDETAHLVRLARERIRCRSIVNKVEYYLLIFGSFQNLLRVLKCNTTLLTRNLESIVKPNVKILRGCGLGDCDIAKLSIAVPRILTADSESLRVMVACAEGVGVPRGCWMFSHALRAVSFLNEEKIAAKMEYLKKTFRWSDAEVRIAVSRHPNILRKSKHMVQRKSEFFISEVGLEPAYIAHRPGLLSYSLEGRLRPRHYVIKFLMTDELLHHDWKYDTIAKLTDKVFVEKFICPHNEAAPHLAEYYAAACRMQRSSTN